MLYVDIPTPAELRTLIERRDDVCVSIFMPTAAAGQGNAEDRITLKNCTAEAIAELQAHGADKKRLVALAEHLDDLVDDDLFWRYQARSLAVLATPDNVATFRLPTTVKTIVEVADRFYLKPLMRAVSFPNAAYVLALSESHVRVVEVSPSLPASDVKLEHMPRDAASAVGKSTINDRSPSGRIQGSEGEKVRLRQYARQVDGALRGLLSGSEVPLILAATEPLAAIFRSVNTYPHLTAAGIGGSPSTVRDDDLAERARPILDELYRERLADWAKRFGSLQHEGRATSDIAQAARAATAGAIESLLVDMDEIVPGTVDAQGAVTFAEAAGPETYGVVDEIADRVIRSGGRVLAVRASEIPGGASVAAILRYPA